MTSRTHYIKWRDHTYQVLRKRVKIQKKSIHKLQRRIASAVGGLRTRQLRVSLLSRHLPNHKWSFLDVSQKVVSAIGFPCPYCHKPIQWNNWSLDHKLPIEKGGRNAWHNIQCICRTCNRRKGAMSHKAYVYLLKTMKKFPDDYAELLSRLAFGGAFHSQQRGK